ELGVSSKEVLERLDRMGEPASSHSSSIDDGVAERLRRDMSNGDGPPEGSGEPIATSPLTRVDPPGEKSGDGDGERAAEAPAASASGAETKSEPARPREAPESKPVTEPPPQKKRFGLFKRKEKPARSRGRRILSQIAELPLLVFVAFLIAVVIKTFFMQAFFIPSGSMRPTLRQGDRVLVEKVTGWFGGPSHGDVVVFARNVFNGNKGPDLPWYRDAQNYVRELLGLPTGREEDYIKRIVAMGGDSVRYQGGVLYVNGERVQEDYLPENNQPGSSFGPDNCPGKMPADDDGCVVPAGNVFVMGDNRDNSADSRSIGPVDEDKIVGRAFVIIWPPDDFSGL
ncbi:MAG: signal peptidase I, partial [Actinomycetota bacterium]|nr:signal peptidase I [Actinomycetota bacterium]